ncbi:MAG: hypothetical protein ACAI35_09120 [Candidatus Methylacidiphilales bacterium]
MNDSSGGDFSPPLPPPPPPPFPALPEPVHADAVDLPPLPEFPPVPDFDLPPPPLPPLQDAEAVSFPEPPPAESPLSSVSLPPLPPVPVEEAKEELQNQEAPPSFPPALPLPLVAASEHEELPPESKPEAEHGSELSTEDKETSRNDESEAPLHASPVSETSEPPLPLIPDFPELPELPSPPVADEPSFLPPPPLIEEQAKEPEPFVPPSVSASDMLSVSVPPIAVPAPSISELQPELATEVLPVVPEAVAVPQPPPESEPQPELPLPSFEAQELPAFLPPPVDLPPLILAEPDLHVPLPPPPLDIESHPDAAYMPRPIFASSATEEVLDFAGRGVIPEVPLADIPASVFNAHGHVDAEPAAADIPGLPPLPPVATLPPPPLFPAPPSAEAAVLDSLLPDLPPSPPAAPPPPLGAEHDVHAEDGDEIHSAPGFLPPSAYAEQETEADPLQRRGRSGKRPLNFTRNQASYLAGPNATARNSPAYASRDADSAEEDDDDDDILDLSESGRGGSGDETGRADRKGPSIKTGGEKEPPKRRPIFSMFSLVGLWLLLIAYIAASGPAFRVASLMIELQSGNVVTRDDDLDGMLATPQVQENVDLIFSPLILSTEYIRIGRKPLVDYVDWWAAYPEAIPVRGRPGFVRSPYVQFEGPIDVTGMAPGSKVHCPYTNKIFVIPRS